MTRILISTIMVSGLVGCGQSTAPPPVVDENVSEAECIVFAKEFQAAVNALDGKKVADSIAWAVMADRSVAEIKTSTKTRESLKRGFVSSASKSDSTFVKEMLNSGKDFEFLRAKSDGGKFRLLFRVFSEGVNYFELYPFRNKAGKIQAFDVYVFATSECMSETIRRLFLTAMPASELEGGKGSARDDAGAAGDAMAKATRAIQAGDAAECLRLIETLPKRLQSDKATLLMRIRASASLGDDKYREAIERFQELHPNDPAGDLLGIDLFVVKKDVEGFKRAMKRLDDRVGGDPFLHAVSSSSLLAMGRPELALEEAETAVKKSPSKFARWAKVRALAGVKRYTDAAAELRDLERDVKETFDVSDDEMAGFRNSKEYKAMRAGR